MHAVCHMVEQLLRFFLSSTRILINYKAVGLFNYAGVTTHGQSPRPSLGTDYLK